MAMLPAMFSLDDQLPHGNALALASGPDGDGWRLAFTASAHGGHERLWFNARLMNHGCRAGLPLTLVLHEADQFLRGDQGSALRPAWRADGGGWQRLPAGNEHRTADGRLEIAWTVPAPAVEAQLAASLPYGEADLRATLAHCGDFWQESRIGTSARDRALLRLANDHGNTPATRPGIACLARNHSGETPGSWALDGFLRQYAQRGEHGTVVWVWPFVDIDGVAAGDYGKGNWPGDFNRAWTAKHSYRHEVTQIQLDLGRWQQRCRPILALDWHAGRLRQDRLHAFGHAAGKDDLVAALAAACGVPPERFVAPGGYKQALADELGLGRAPPTATDHLHARFGIPALAMEIPYLPCGGQEMLADDYRAIGARCADACLAWAARQT